MNYDYEGVTEVRHDKTTKKLELVTGGKKVTVEGVDSLFLKSVAWVDENGTAYLNNGRVSLKGKEAAVGD